jgi:hypothetical protein
MSTNEHCFYHPWVLMLHYSAPANILCSKHVYLDFLQECKISHVRIKLVYFTTNGSELPFKANYDISHHSYAEGGSEAARAHPMFLALDLNGRLRLLAWDN